jgi:hypothetical protein
MTQFSIPVIEYDCARPGVAIAPAQPFVVNDRQLVLAMVRSVLTVNSRRASRKYMAAIVKPTLRFLLDWNRAPDLSLSAHFLNVLRDFSATTRIGELAQGVSYAYWKWQRGYHWIADFGPWVAGLHPPYAGMKSPDFVMLNSSINDLAVMESKGTSLSCHKSAMGTALRQCKDAVNHPSFSRSFGSVLTLDSKNPSGVGTLHIRDPERTAELSAELSYYVFRRSFASWFELTGDENLAEWCRQEFKEGSDPQQSSRQIPNDNGEKGSSLRVITAAALGFNPDRVSFEIDPLFAQALGDFNVFKNSRVELGNRGSTIGNIPGRGSIRFPDGTLIVER